MKVRLPYCGKKQVGTDRTIANNKPDFITSDNNITGTFMFIDVAITGARNVIKKEAERV
jgi:hypothetical protein